MGFSAWKQLQMSLTWCVAYGAVQGETQNRGGEQLVAASRVLLRSLIDFILELLRELQGDGNCHYKLPRSLRSPQNVGNAVCFRSLDLGGRNEKIRKTEFGTRRAAVLFRN